MDDFTDDFAEILACVESYITTAASKLLGNRLSLAGGRQQSSAFYGSSILPTVNLIAYKFRDLHLRHRALELLGTA